MAGTLTLGGQSDGLLSGGMVFGPSSINGRRAIGYDTEVLLVANVDYSIVLPTEAVAYAVWFTFGGEATGEIKIGSNLVATSSGMPVKAEGFFAAPIASTMTELKFKSASPPAAFQVSII